MADASLPLDIRYQPAIAGLMLVSSLFILGTTALVGVSLNTVTGVILLLVSIGYFTQPAIVVTSSGFEHRNILGMTMKRNDFGSLADVLVEDGAVYVQRKGAEREKVIGLRFHLSGADLAKLEEMARAARAKTSA